MFVLALRHYDSRTVSSAFNDDFILSNSELFMLIDLCVNETVTYVTLENYYI